jgi:hypothetical protein
MTVGLVLVRAEFAAGPAMGSAVVDDHLVADTGRADAWALEIADVIVRRDYAAQEASSAWFARTFASYPGCVVAAVTDAGGGHTVGLRDGRTIRFTPRCGREWVACRTAMACASFAYVWMATGCRLAALDSRGECVEANLDLICLRSVDLGEQG